MSKPPEEIRTERLVLRRIGEADLTAMIEVHGDPETNRHNPTGPAGPEEVREHLVAWQRDWARHGIGYWAIEVATTGEVVGFGGLRLFEFDGRPALNLYYRFRPSAWGRGYATEMARAAVDWAHGVRPEPVVIRTATTNAAAARVAERLGFPLTGTIVLDGAEAFVFTSRRS
ncbi:GNAT family N-acetyltransferase [Streptoalloteichus hindustanus]|uniref:GNAT family N-acetyltransferase n=1 Tax=Streptoalloteichus hindustanus TaxID=2017 RepID=UPI00093596F6|nr:GNAT family N-acetyltransferase [Streptoalloteichus hindustanus]